MTEEELKELAFKILEVARVLELYKVSVDSVYSIKSIDAELFNYHAGRFLSTIYDTLQYDVNKLQEVAEKILKNYE